MLVNLKKRVCTLHPADPERTDFSHVPQLQAWCVQARLLCGCQEQHVAFGLGETCPFWPTCRQANKTGPVANPSLRSAAAGLPRRSAHDVKSSTSSISWKKINIQVNLRQGSFWFLKTRYRIILVKIYRKNEDNPLWFLRQLGKSLDSF